MTHSLTFFIRNTCTFLLVLLLCSVFSADAQRCSWARSMGGRMDEVTTAMVVDPEGNTYVTGYFESDTAFFGRMLFGTNPLTRSLNIFLAKYNAVGDMVWAKRCGDRAAEPVSIALDKSGNIFLYGFFVEPTITFGDSTLTNATDRDPFLIKLNNDGAVLWTTSVQFDKYALSAGAPVAVATDEAGNVVITGFFSTDVTIGGHVLHDGPGHRDVFLAKYNSRGGLLWAESTNSTDIDIVKALAIDRSGNIYFAGAKFGPTISLAGMAVVDSAANAFLVKCNGDGAPIWVKSFGGYGNYISLATDAAGYLYVGGDFKSVTAKFDSIILTNPDSSGMTPDIFLAKSDPSGHFIWARKEGEDNEILSLVADQSGSLFLSGWFGRRGDSIGLFVAKYGSSGDPVWISGGTCCVNSAAVGFDANGNVYVAGKFSSPTLTFDSVTITNSLPPYFSTVLGFDVYLARYGDATAAVAQVNLNEQLARLYPNPAQNEMIMEAKESIRRVTITNITGQIVHDARPDCNKVKVNVADLPPGLYLVRVNDTQTLKFVKQ